MCLGELGRITHLTGDGRAVVDADGRQRAVSLLTLHDPVTTGDWVLIHSGFALARLSPEQARDSLLIRTTDVEDLP